MNQENEAAFKAEWELDYDGWAFGIRVAASQHGVLLRRLAYSFGRVKVALTGTAIKRSCFRSLFLTRKNARVHDRIPLCLKMARQLIATGSNNTHMIYIKYRRWDWPGNSPDLNAIEPAWCWVTHHVR